MDRAARHLASYGRHGDDTLLHVSRAELAGIRQLTGKGFTTNPDTGLPEAFNWAKAILPAIAGIGITALTGGLGAPAALAGLAGAAGSGATSFGIGKAQGESTNQALMGGLISGATSFAGGQLLSGVGDAAAGAVPSSAVAETASGQIAGTALPGEAGMFVGGGAAPNAASATDSVFANQLSAAGPATAANGMPLPPTPPVNPDAAQLSGNPFFQNAAGGQPIGPVSAVTPVQPPSIGGSFSNLGDRVSNVVSDPGRAISQVGSNIANRPMAALTAGAGLYSSMSSPTGQPRIPREAPYDPSKYPERFPAQQPRYTPDPAGYVPGISPERNYNFAKGGLASLRGEEGMTANIVNEAKAALLNEHPRPKEALARFEGMFGADALGMLRDRIAGGRTTGPGSGMDDLIPGTIEGRQKVRLADGEFVVPADVVSGLGDGSTDHGVRRLHEMMNSVRKQRTGKETQPKSIGGKITL
jgi:hypothetical protein